MPNELRSNDRRHDQLKTSSAKIITKFKLKIRINFGGLSISLLVVNLLVSGLDSEREQIITQKSRSQA